MKQAEKNRQMVQIAVMGLIVLVSSFWHARTTLAEGPVSLTVSPLSYDLKINPGDEQSGEIAVGNDSQESQDIQVEYSDFFVDDSGSYIFSDGKDIENDNLRPFVMNRWFSIDKPEFSIDKGKSEKIKYKIQVPKDATLGGHYGVIFFRTKCAIEADKNVVYTDKSSVCVSGRVGVLFLVQAGGEAVKKGEIKKLVLPRISFSDKSKMTVEIANVGNTHFKPDGEIFVKSIFGRVISQTDIKDKTILPTMSRVFAQDLSRGDFLGLYKVTGRIKDGDGHDMQFQKYIFLVPWKELLVILALVGAWIWLIKRYKISLRHPMSK